MVGFQSVICSSLARCIDLEVLTLYSQSTSSFSSCKFSKVSTKLSMYLSASLWYCSIESGVGAMERGVDGCDASRR